MEKWRQGKFNWKEHTNGFPLTTFHYSVLACVLAIPDTLPSDLLTCMIGWLGVQREGLCDMNTPHLTLPYLISLYLFLTFYYLLWFSLSPLYFALFYSLSLYLNAVLFHHTCIILRSFTSPYVTYPDLTFRLSHAAAGHVHKQMIRYFKDNILCNIITITYHNISLFLYSSTGGAEYHKAVLRNTFPLSLWQLSMDTGTTIKVFSAASPLNKLVIFPIHYQNNKQKSTLKNTSIFN